MLALEVRQRGEDASYDHTSLDLGESKGDLIESGRIGWGEVHVKRGMCGEECADLLGLACWEGVGDNVNSLAADG